MSFERKYLRKPVNRTERALKSFLRTAPTAFLSGYRMMTGSRRGWAAELRPVMPKAGRAWMRLPQNWACRPRPSIGG